MVVFEIILIAVCVSGIALCASANWRPKQVLSELGQHGQMWFDHADERDIEHQPTDDATEDAVAFRPLRSRLR